MYARVCARVYARVYARMYARVYARVVWHGCMPGCGYVMLYLAGPSLLALAILAHRHVITQDLWGGEGAG